MYKMHLVSPCLKTDRGHKLMNILRSRQPKGTSPAAAAQVKLRSDQGDSSVFSF